MEKVFLLMFAAIMFFSMENRDVQMNLKERALLNMQYAKNNAIHDAGLQVDEDRISDMEIVYEQGRAITAFKQSLVRNLNLNSDLTPKFSHFYKKPIEIIHMDFIDYSGYTNPVTGSPISYPFKSFIYKFKDVSNGIDIERPINGPSIVAILKTTIISDDEPTYFVAIEEYKY
ncbi:hypothetical protein GLW08_20455 [Pontibacillus yanchengensis]|uniref:Uncharacterized protein n=2 Tax=Pontibacillus yanchengensis TaxID=462910 RepID=A0ACC7VLI0_9BACI|nr:hypothetical protein [Pontibacillus yanchengensis]MYL35477.1 hypothetical protein [Pontibacillus yanchengensis]MYL55677.1 hypothetical protein [Pontibacillus yanchengensis]